VFGVNSSSSGGALTWLLAAGTQAPIESPRSVPDGLSWLRRRAGGAGIPPVAARPATSATPAPPAVLLGGQALATLVIALGMAAVLLLVARLAYGVSMPVGALAAAAIAVVVGTLSFACIGYAVAGLVGSPDSAQPIVQATLLPLYFISGVWIPLASLGHTLRSIASLFPVEHLANSLHLASVMGSFGTALHPADLLVLAAWGAGAAVLAVRRFSWLPSPATA